MAISINCTRAYSFIPAADLEGSSEVYISFAHFYTVSEATIYAYCRYIIRVGMYLLSAHYTCI